MQTAPLPSSPDIVIVGAGAAGIAAGRALQAMGIPFAILEAAGRIGGRAYTESETFGVPFDHGCAWLQGPEGLPHTALASTEGFTLIDHSDPPGALFTGGRRATPEEEGAYAAAGERLDAAARYSASDMAVSDTIAISDPWMAAAATWLGAMDHGADVDELSCADVAVYGEYAVNALVREGLGALAVRVGAGLPIRTGVCVTGIDWSGAGVIVQTDKGDLQARAVILTVSTGVLAAGAIRFTPGLPDITRAAIDDLPMGLLTKIALHMDGARFGIEENAFLTRSIHTPLPARAAFFLGFPAGFDLCVGFTGGRIAWEIEREGEAAAIDFAISELAGMLGNAVRRRVRKGRMTRWADDPYTRGAYAFARPGRHGARAALLSPVGERIFLAGEALGGAYPALLSGAHLSGEAAARKAAAAIAGAQKE